MLNFVPHLWVFKMLRMKLKMIPNFEIFCPQRAPSERDWFAAVL